MITYIKNDLVKMALNHKVDVIAHGCNCFNVMGSGIAKTIRENFPQAFIADGKTLPGALEKLGTITTTDVTNFPVVVNCYTQYGYGSMFERVLEYGAIRSAMIKLFEFCKCNIPSENKLTVGLPYIGAGLAGGNWDVILKIIQEEYEKYTNEFDLIIVEFIQN